MIKTVHLPGLGKFDPVRLNSYLIHDSPYLKILIFNFTPGQELALHTHELEGQKSLHLVSGQGEFLGPDGAACPAQAGDLLICDISEPHGFRATTAATVLVTMAPPI
jgi:quercetin dioxygenase-like cupin family protein